MKYSKYIKILLPVIMLITGLYLFPIQIVNSDFSKIPGDLGDARFNNYILEHGYQFISGKVVKYWDTPIMYPSTNVIAYSDNLLGTMPFYAAFRLIGFDRETSFQLWIVLLFALNFICCYWALNKWTGDVVISVTGAYVFAFSIFILGTIMNAQMFPRFVIPLVVYWSWKYLTERNTKYFLFMVLGLVYQFYCGIYLGLFLIAATFFFILSYFIIYKDTAFLSQFKNPKNLRQHFYILAIGLITMAPLMIPYIEVRSITGDRNFADLEHSIPTLQSYFFSSNASRIWQFLSHHATKNIEQWWFHILFAGALPWLGILILLLTLGLKKIQIETRQFLKFLGLCLLLNFIFYLNISGFSLYKLIYYLPGFGAIRSVNRVIATEIIFFVLIFAFTTYYLMKSGYIKYRLIWFCLPLLAIIDNLIIPSEVYRFDKSSAAELVVNCKSSIINQIDDYSQPVAVFQIDKPYNEVEHTLTVMLACQELGISCVNGYSGWIPPLFGEYYYNNNYSGLSTWCASNNIPERNVKNVYFSKNENLNIRPIRLIAANNKYLCVDHNSNDIIIANKNIPSYWELFLLIQYEDNKFAILSDEYSYFCAELKSNNELTATREYRKEWETFTIVSSGIDSISLLANNQKYVSVDTSSLQLFAVSDSIGKYEKFKIIYE